MFEILEKSFVLFLFITILFIVLLWFFIKSAIKSGTKEAIIESYREILLIEKDPRKKASFSKTANEELQEELNNW